LGLGAQAAENGMPPVVTSITLELGLEIAPNSVGNHSALVRENLPAMRERIRASAGVEVPGVSVTTNTAIPGGSYMIKIDEVPVDTGSSGPTLSDGSGATADSRQSIVSHLEAVLRRNLADFIGLEEVQTWLNGWDIYTTVTPAVPLVVTDLASRIRLARVLRALARESVSITGRDEILQVLSETWQQTLDVPTVTRAVRLRIRSHLPGQDRTRLPAPDWLSNKL